MRHNHAVVMIPLRGASLGVSAMSRCTDASGKVSYSDKPCPIADRQSRDTISGTYMIGRNVSQQ